MKPPAQGNGSGKIDIHQQDMGGWVRVFTEKTQVYHQDLPTFLSLGLTEWFRQRPHLRMCALTGVVKDGDTVELHCWYDCHVFPNLMQDPQIQK